MNDVYLYKTLLSHYYSQDAAHDCLLVLQDQAEGRQKFCPNILDELKIHLSNATLGQSLVEQDLIYDALCPYLKKAKAVASPKQLQKIDRFFKEIRTLPGLNDDFIELAKTWNQSTLYCPIPPTMPSTNKATWGTFFTLLQLGQTALSVKQTCQNRRPLALAKQCRLSAVCDEKLKDFKIPKAFETPPEIRERGLGQKVWEWVEAACTGSPSISRDTSSLNDVKEWLQNSHPTPNEIESVIWKLKIDSKKNSEKICYLYHKAGHQISDYTHQSLVSTVCSNDDVKTLRFLHQTGNLRELDLDWLLSYAAIHERYSVARYLIPYLIKEQGPSAFPALTSDMARLLLENGIPIHPESVEALKVAIEFQTLSVEEAIEKFLTAAQHGEIVEFIELLNSHYEIPQTVKNEALQIAHLQHNQAAMDILLKVGSDPWISPAIASYFLQRGKISLELPHENGLIALAELQKISPVHLENYFPNLTEAQKTRVLEAVYLHQPPPENALNWLLPLPASSQIRVVKAAIHQQEASVVDTLIATCSEKWSLKDQEEVLALRKKREDSQKDQQEKIEAILKIETKRNTKSHDDDWEVKTLKEIGHLDVSSLSTYTFTVLSDGVAQIRAFPHLIVKEPLRSSFRRYDRIKNVRWLKEICKQNGLDRIYFPKQLDYKGNVIEEKMDLQGTDDERIYEDRIRLMNSDPRTKAILDEQLTQLARLTYLSGLSDIKPANIPFYPEKNGFAAIDTDSISTFEDGLFYFDSRFNLITHTPPDNFEAIRKALPEGYDFDSKVAHHKEKYKEQEKILQKARAYRWKAGIFQPADPIPLKLALEGLTDPTEINRATELLDLINQRLNSLNSQTRKIVIEIKPKYMGSLIHFMKNNLIFQVVSESGTWVTGNWIIQC